MDGLAVVTSRPHLLGFSIRQNVSLKVSGLRALMARQRAGPEEPRQEQHQQQQQQQTSASVRKTWSAAFRPFPVLFRVSPVFVFVFGRHWMRVYRCCCVVHRTPEYMPSPPPPLRSYVVDARFSIQRVYARSPSS